jgi:hypothetical protein
MLDELGITHIINLAGNVCANKFPESFKYRRYYLKDSRFEVNIYFYYFRISNAYFMKPIFIFKMFLRKEEKSWFTVSKVYQDPLPFA